MPFGGAAIDAIGDPLPAETLEACRAADAVLLGAVGGPQWDGGPLRPEAGLLGLRKELDVYANLRPAVGAGVDLLIVRELVGGLYFGARGVREDGTVFDTCEYHPDQVERIARRAFELARTPLAAGSSRSTRRTCSTPRACGGASSRSSRAEYPDVELRHGLVDSVAMQLVMDPPSFDTLVMENMFGDILSDVAAGVTGGLGLARPRASATRARASSSRCTARRPTSPEPGPRTRRRCFARSRCCSSTGSASRLSRARSRRPSTRAIAATPTPDLGGTATTSEFGSTVVAALASEVPA